MRHRWVVPSAPLTTSTTERICTKCGLRKFTDFSRTMRRTRTVYVGVNKQTRDKALGCS